MTVKIIQSDLIKDQTKYLLSSNNSFDICLTEKFAHRYQDFTKLSTSLQEFKTLNIEN